MEEDWNVIGSWIVEFLLRHSSTLVTDHFDDIDIIDSSSETRLDSLFSSLLRPFNFSTIPLSMRFRLSKSLLLRRLSSHLSSSISDNTLRLLLLIYDLDHHSHTFLTPSFKHAFCHVAVHCTLTQLHLLHPSLVQDLVTSIITTASGLVSDDLLSWMDHILLASSSSTDFCPTTWPRNNHLDPVSAVRSYLDEAWELMGPTFLDHVASIPQATNLLLGPGSSEDTHHQLPPNDSRMQTSRKHLAAKRTGVSVSGTSRGAKITDPEQVANEVLSERYGGCLPSSAINKIQQALKSTTLGLNPVVTDPLPEAVEIAENAISSKNKDDGNEEKGSDPKRPSTIHENNVRRPSLMTRNTSAHTVEWDDSIDDLPEGDTGSRRRIKLPSPNNRVVSPMKIHQVGNRKGRKKYITWTALEEETLRTGVKNYGEGCWTSILNSNRDVFKTRTAVDLKDKWRNLTK